MKRKRYFLIGKLNLFCRGPDLDDDDDDSGGGAKPGPSNGHVKPKTKQQMAGEQLLKHILDRVDGGSYSFRYTHLKSITAINQQISSCTRIIDSNASSEQTPVISKQFMLHHYSFVTTQCIYFAFEPIKLGSQFLVY